MRAAASFAWPAVSTFSFSTKRTKPFGLDIDNALSAADAISAVVGSFAASRSNLEIHIIVGEEAEYFRTA
jgi:hypothetical protein